MTLVTTSITHGFYMWTLIVRVCSDLPSSFWVDTWSSPVLIVIQGTVGTVIPGPLKGWDTDSTSFTMFILISLIMGIDTLPPPLGIKGYKLWVDCNVISMVIWMVIQVKPHILVAMNRQEAKDLFLTDKAIRVRGKVKERKQISICTLTAQWRYGLESIQFKDC